MRPNTVKRLLREGRPAIGTWLALGSPLAGEWLAHQGFDYLNVEQEHSAIDIALTQRILQAISTTEVMTAAPSWRVRTPAPSWDATGRR